VNPNFKKLTDKLNELFMLDHEELDFGIYRIMNYRRREIQQFIQQDLLAQVKAELNLTGNVSRTQKQAELDKIIKQLVEADIEPDTSPKVQNLRKELTELGNPEAMENEVFSRLYDFFSRYYQDGDFISLRRYKKDIYAVPYEGEEVKLHWANADQYYIKSSEYFKNYRFTLADGRKVVFTLREASTEQNNNKAIGATERRFRLADDPLSITGDTLTIFFNYEPVDKSVKRETLIEQATERLKERVPSAFQQVWEKRPTANQKDRSLLEKHLNDYTARHAFDYFIHKDLGGFLNRELDFFIKNEVLLIDDIAEQAQAVANMTRQFAKIVAIKKIARKIIAFLASLEDFQRSLWLKKKWVTQAHYCLSLDRVPKQLYAEIAANEKQIDEWCNLLKINEIAQNTEGGILFQSEPFSRPLSLAFLEQHPHLMLDTAHFSPDFKNRLLAELPQLDLQTEGLLLHADNFQALAFLQNRFREQVKCVYIDPPYNADATAILYKNEYRHSSWLSFIYDRVDLSRNLMSDEGLLCITIDDYEYHLLQELFLGIFGEENYLATAVIRNNPSGRSTVNGFSVNHEYGLFYANGKNYQLGRLPHSQEQLARYDQNENGETPYEWENFRKSSAGSNKIDRPKQFYPIYFDANVNSLRVPNLEWSNSTNSWIVNENPNSNEITLLPINQNGIEKVWLWGIDRFRNFPNELKVVSTKSGYEVYKKKYLNEDGVLPRTWWDKAAYSARDNGSAAISNLFGDKSAFDFPKSAFAVEDTLKILNLQNNDFALDYFAGSGTTGHAVLNLNREDGGKRQYILVEQGEYFDTVLLPRLKKVVYAKDWKNGSPVRRDTGMSHGIKYLRLESYEDTLNNLALSPPTALQELALTDANHTTFRESYYLRYLFGEGSRATLADTEGGLRQPFDLRLRLLRHNEEVEQAVDVVETFNYLLGLVVESRYTVNGFTVVVGTTLADASGRTQSVLIVWRNCLEKTADDLNQFFEKQGFNTRDREYNVIYVNGDHTLPNILDEATGAKVRLIESELRRLMFV
jgi:adenine-specific DNA-methyltransferase